MKGFIIRLMPEGFGYLSGPHGSVYFHCTCLEGIPFEELNVGDLVEFELICEEKNRDPDEGPRACVVRLPASIGVGGE